ncbi:MAG: DUF2061 domain-containing protein [Pseudomonadales bacterium]|nr:DUF2061 domain-containing protein [Pseudomonadales bacterium]
MDYTHYRETHLRSLAKALSWRITATLTTGIIAYFITGDFMTALTIGGIEFVIKFAIYYGHERMWEVVPFGRKVVAHTEEADADRSSPDLDEITKSAKGQEVPAS